MRGYAIVGVLKKLEELQLFSNSTIRAFAIDNYVLAENIINIFTDQLNEYLFLRLITLHNHARYLTRENIIALAVHPNREGLFHVLDLFRNYGLLVDSRYLPTVFHYDETIEGSNTITDIVKTMESHSMVNKHILHLCAITPCGQRNMLHEVLCRISERVNPLDEDYLFNASKVIRTFMHLDMLTHENIDLVIDYARDKKTVNALYYLGKLITELDNQHPPITLSQPTQHYVNAFVIHPHAQEIAFCAFQMWHGNRVVDIDTCLTITDLNMIRFITKFIDSATLNQDVFNGLIQLGHIFKEQDIKEIADAFSCLHHCQLSNELWADERKHILQLCVNAQENPVKTKVDLIEYAQSIKRKDDLKQKEYFKGMFSTSNTTRPRATFQNQVESESSCRIA